MERRLTNKAIRHWKEWLPNRYAELLEANQLITAAEAAAKGAAQEMKALMDAGMRRDEAEEIVLPKWILLPPESSASEDADWEDDELAELEDQYREMMRAGQTLTEKINWFENNGLEFSMTIDQIKAKMDKDEFYHYCCSRGLDPDQT